MVSFKFLLLETRPQFLLLTVLLVSLGTAVAFNHGFFNPVLFALNMAGALLAHVSVNVLNDYFDFKSGLDVEIVKSGRKTPFSGGSGLLPSELISPVTTFKLGVISLLTGLAIGAYFVYLRGIVLLPIIAVAVASTAFYTVFFAKICLGELLAGLNFGPLMVTGTYIVQAGLFNIWEALTASLAPGILTANLLLINQFPDTEADRKVGRKHFVIVLGKKGASKLYTALTAASYLSIVTGVYLEILPLTVLIALLTVPFAYKACRIAVRHYDSLDKIVEALKQNVLTVLGTQGLMVVGYLIASIVP